jgi:hypothetical protein
MGKRIIKLSENDLYRIVKKIINEQLSDQSIPYDIIEFVYNTTPISDFTSLDEYYEFVNEFYSDYYPTQHSSVDSGILKSDIKTPEQMGVKGYNSVDAFFVTPDIDISRNNVSYVGRDAKNAINYIVMVPESLNFLETDYDFSNVEGLMDSILNTKGYTPKVIGDKVRELGYDVIIPDKGHYEWIIVNPQSLVVLGSDKDIRNFMGWLNSKL